MGQSAVDPSDCSALEVMRRRRLGRYGDGLAGWAGVVLAVLALVRWGLQGGTFAAVAPLLVIGAALLVISRFSPLARLLNQASSRAGVRRLRRLCWLLPLLSILAFLLVRWHIDDPAAYNRAVEEGSVVEWLTFIFFLLAALLAMLCSLQAFARQRRLEAAYWLALSGLLFAVGMEEMSWGQMIFNWGTPAFYQGLNVQGETNLHNVVKQSRLAVGVAAGLSVLTVLPFVRVRVYVRPGCKGVLARVAPFLPGVELLPCIAYAAITYILLSVDKNVLNVPGFMSCDQEPAELALALATLLYAVQHYLWQPRRWLAELDSVDSV